MHAALQNTHYKTIWENVLMNRHPEAESLEDASENELQYDNCLLHYPHQIENDDVGSVAELRVAIIATKQNKGYTAEEIDDNIKNDIRDNVKALNMFILGRPITLENILLLLKNQISAIDSLEKVDEKLRNLNFRCRTVTSRNIRYTYNSYTQAYIRQEYAKEVCGNVLFVGLMIEIQRFWQLTNPLHEQTPQTWERIAELINKI